ncbi:MAG: dihydroorotase, partial [Phormidesmis sp.]
MATLIQQVYMIDPVDPAAVGADSIGDVLIEAGRIVAIAPTLPTPTDATEIIDGRGQFLGPGLIDLYSQSGEPGNESRETYESIIRAAAAGGFTRIGLLPNTQPTVDSVSAISALRQLKQQQHRAKIMPWAAITRGAAGEQLTELTELAEAGAVGFTDAQPLNNSALLRRLLEYAQPLHKPIALWPCDLKLAGGGAAREGPDALRLGLQGVSAIAETTALAALLEYIAEIPTPIHIMRVSTARSVALIRQAKAQGLPVTASVPWHHLIFDTQDLSQYDPTLRHDPPLGTPADRQGLIAGVTEGVIDAIAIDHSAYTYEEKTVAFDDAPPGAIGLELALPVLWQTFVTSGQWSPANLWQCLSQGPARCLG